MVAEHGMLRGTTTAAEAVALGDTLATATTAVVTMAATGDVLAIGTAACRHRLQRVRGDEQVEAEDEPNGRDDAPTGRQLDFTGTATGSREAPRSPATRPRDDTASPMSVQEFVEAPLGGPAPEAPHNTEATAEQDNPRDRIPGDPQKVLQKNTRCGHFFIRTFGKHTIIQN